MRVSLPLSVTIPYYKIHRLSYFMRIWRINVIQSEKGGKPQTKLILEQACSNFLSLIQYFVVRGRILNKKSLLNLFLANPQ